MKDDERIVELEEKVNQLIEKMEILQNLYNNSLINKNG
jgi:hypothetical protein